ncbi:MAG: DUF2806 domain-containing protein [Planctomycetes bacterium]|nr:DUF2806 domain-containing protein [Planctomycetota bacterium]
MPEGSSLINFGDLGKPATTFIEKISEAIGGWCKPGQIERVAKAEAKAAIIKAQGQIEVTDLERRAMARLVGEEARKQENMEAIAEQAIPQLDDAATPQDMEDDWVANFFDKCRITSDKEMQALWARVLAGEANAKGTFAKRTVNLLAELDKSDARLFTSLCGFAWVIRDVVPLIYDDEHSIYNEAGIDFESLEHLHSIGLASFAPLSGYKKTGFSSSRSFRAYYFGQSLIVGFRQPKENEIDIGKVLLTQTGKQLARICQSKPVESFLEYIVDKWSKKGLILSSSYPRAT